MDNKKRSIQLTLERARKALENNHFAVDVSQSREEAKQIVQALLQVGDVVTCGGSMTLEETGIKALLANGDYTFLDRETDPNGGTADFYRRALSSDVYLTSSNAITENGELYNVDGIGNRVAAFSFGPKKVIVVAGYNKIVRDITEAVKRVKTQAAPKNGMRLHKQTPCVETGHCSALDGLMTDGCQSNERLCRHYVTTGRQHSEAKRIHVVLVGEELGY